MPTWFIFLLAYFAGVATRVIVRSIIDARRDRDELRELLREVDRRERR